MALCELLLLICVSTTFYSSLTVAWRANVGVGGYGLAFIVGLAVSVLFGWTMHSTHKTLANRFETHPRGKHDLLAWSLYFSDIVLITFAGYTGVGLTSWLMRIVF